MVKLIVMKLIVLFEVSLFQLNICSVATITYVTSQFNFLFSQPMFTCYSICIIICHVIKHMCEICDKNISNKKNEKLRN